MNPRYPVERNKGRNEQGTEQCVVSRALAPRPVLAFPLPKFAERKELGDLFALSSINQVARVGISSNLDFITIFSLAPGFTLKVKFGEGGAAALSSLPWVLLEVCEHKESSFFCS